MKQILSSRFVDIPKGVTVDVKARVVTVKGPRGELTKDFKKRQKQRTDAFRNGTIKVYES